ncbi:NAD(P)/FAD-dependent oxidoreductase [Eubacterium barkeri]|uniref:Pyridine nucleotide-disulphide oxidoreductase n=1 Tax=Eubacterium barkeri TaxID=1528 RepID=A0A1H3JHE0_EUBBA|nr:FAD-dependent oxidoreductase [Eubacterium barkeri]SDY39351.1 Pyridine nucleotide-disulphide oxidoreductase [Eubacterium barkeri]
MADTHSKYLIIGNAIAAVGGITGIRTVDPLGSITVISGEDRPVYSRPLISYWLEGRVEKENIRYRDRDFYEKNDVSVEYGVMATAVDAKRKIVTLTGGRTISYEKLLVATGSHPFVPPIPGRDSAKNTFTFTTMDDAEGIAEVLTPESQVVILGAGLIGLKAGEALMDQCGSLTVVDLADQVLPSVLDAECAALYADYLEGLGMALRLGTSITQIGEGEVTLSDGNTLAYDILILAVGTRPESSLVESAGGDVQRGIVTDRQQRTTLLDVYAAGDCTQSYDCSSETEKNMAILPNAYLQGEVAGINMAGGEAVYTRAFPVNAMGIKGYYMLTAGSTMGDPVVVEEKGTLKKFYIQDDRLVGFIILGDCDRGGIYTELIRNQTPLSETDWAMLMEAPRLAAFGKNIRKADLAEAH